LDDPTRRSLCALWRACLFGDAATKQAVSEQFAGPMAHFFPLLLSEWFLVLVQEQKLPRHKPPPLRHLPVRRRALPPPPPPPQKVLVEIR